MGIIRVQEPQTAFEKASQAAWQATQAASDDDTGANHKRAAELHLAAAALAEQIGETAEAAKHGAQGEEHIRQLNMSGTTLESRAAGGGSPTVYNSLRQSAEAATQLAKDRPTVNNHRRAAQAHLVAAAHASQIGNGDAAKDHDETADFHIEKMKELDCE